MKVVIAITGQKRAGKDSLAKILMLKNKSFVKYAFADPVRDAAKAFFGWNDYMFDDEHKEVIDPYWGISPRQALQFIGTEVGREGFAKQFPEFAAVTGSNIWINRAKKFIEELPKGKNAVISDMRFLNELYSVVDLPEKDYKVITVGIRRPGANGDMHASETEVEDCINRCKYEFVNDGSFDELEDYADAILMGEGLL